MKIDNLAQQLTMTTVIINDFNQKVPYVVLIKVSEPLHNEDVRATGVNSNTREASCSKKDIRQAKHYQLMALLDSMGDEIAPSSSAGKLYVSLVSETSISK